MLEKVRNTLSQFNMIQQGEVVVVGVSGGADSVALLLNLSDYRKSVDFEIKVVHVNHLIREDASEDAEFVRGLCEQLDIEFFLYEIDVEELAGSLHLSTEEAGRKARYDAMRGLKPDKIAVGHHRDDQAETVLLNMCRGTGLHGMKGILPIQDNIIRPLLYVTREEIEKYLLELCQPYRTDSTNMTTDYMRNRFRHNVIPYLTEEINEKAVLHITDMASDMSELECYINGVVNFEYDKLCQPCEDGTVISLEGFLSLDGYIQKELLLLVIEHLTPKRKDITRAHIKSIIDLCNLSGEKSVDLPYELKAIKSYDQIIIKKKNGAIEQDDTFSEITITKKMLEKECVYELNDGRNIHFRLIDWQQNNIIENNDFTKLFDYDKIKCSLELRNRQEGDFLIINNQGQKKSIKEYMINEKIPMSQREDVVLLAEGNHILWVTGYRISSYYKIDENTKKVLEVFIN